MMSQHILDSCWFPFFYHKDPYRIKFSRFYLLWDVRYQHLCNFLHLQKCDNYVITPSNVWIFFQDSNLSEPGQKYPHMPKISPGGLPVSSINSVHINIYIYIYTIKTRLKCICVCVYQTWGQALSKGLKSKPKALSEGLKPKPFF